MGDIHDFCSKHRLKLDKDLGQHFLIDENVLSAIVGAAHIQSNEHVVEIGAGIGILTKELVARAGTVTAIEFDKRLIPLLKEYTSVAESRGSPLRRCIP